MVNKILIPTDGSDKVERAVEKGLEIAEVFDADVHALYVVETGATYVLTVGLSDNDMQEYEEYGDEVVSDIVARANDRGLNAGGTIKRGKVSEEIVDYADDNDIDHIVMGGQGHGAIEKYLGSTAEKVVRMSAKPVTIVSPASK